MAELLPETYITILENQLRLLKADLVDRDDNITQLSTKLGTALRDIANRDAQIQALKNRGKFHEVTWHDKLSDFLDGSGGLTYQYILEFFCKERNMSILYTYVHPNILFQARPQDDAQDDVNEAMMEVVGGISVRRASNENGQPTTAQVWPTTFYQFHRLPPRCVKRVFELLLHKKGHLIHCVSRLDPYLPPTAKVVSPPHVFHWGCQECVITDAKDPNDVLSILLVCKRFLFLGAHAFYGLNTFAFSSLGEFNVFCGGIGPSRYIRLQHVELLMVGSSYLTRERDRKNKANPLRTLPLLFLPTMHRLRALVVHLRESCASYRRRKYETKAIVQFQARFSEDHPNYRMKRDLRKLHGLDRIQMLRGLRWVRFYDLDHAAKGAARIDVRDSSFLRDMNEVCTAEKSKEWQIHETLRGLAPLLPKNDSSPAYTPTDDEWTMVEGWYGEGDADQAPRAYDELFKLGLHKDLSADPGMGDGDDEDQSSSSDESSDDEQGNHDDPNPSDDSDGSSDSSSDGGSSPDPSNHETGISMGNPGGCGGIANTDDTNTSAPEDELFVPQMCRPGHESAFIEIDDSDDSEVFEVKSPSRSCSPLATLPSFEPTSTATDETPQGAESTQQTFEDEFHTAVSKLSSLPPPPPSAPGSAAATDQSPPASGSSAGVIDLTMGDSDEDSDVEIVQVRQIVKNEVTTRAQSTVQKRVASPHPEPFKRQKTI